MRTALVLYGRESLPMAETTARLLTILSLLQSRPRWSGPELADRAGVTVRTIRRDVERLRLLGYPIVTEHGASGGYHLGRGGSSIPPLMLDRDEALAVAVCLRSAATDLIAGGTEAAVRALAKLDQLLPPTVARQVGTIGSVTTRLDSHTSPVDPDVLIAVTRACRDSERLRVVYVDRSGNQRERTIDPYRVVSTGRRWYLVAHDRDRDDWRTFRVDRLLDVAATGHRVQIPDPPDAELFVRDAITTAPYAHQVRVLLHAPLEAMQEAIPVTVGMLERHGTDATILTTGADDVDMIVFHLLRLDVGFGVLDGDALEARLGQLHARIGSALASTSARLGD